MPRTGLYERNALKLAREAQEASRVVAQLATPVKNAILRAWADGLMRGAAELIRANARDCTAAAKAGLSAAMIDRLRLDAKGVARIAAGVREVAALPDPVGEVIWTNRRPNRLLVRRVRVPLGTILIIYESRPNVTVEAAALCFKSGNACILRGGKEAQHSNRAICGILSKVLKRRGVLPAAVSFVTVQDRGFAGELLKRNDCIDLVIPRGGESLIRAVAESSRIPVIKHYRGVCHVYIDAAADPVSALRIAVNSKTQRPGVCNAAECFLVHEKIAPRLLPALMKALAEKQCEVRADPKARKWMKGAKPAQAGDFGQEFLDLIVAVRVVRSLDEALAHIARYGSQHTEAIVSRDAKVLARFRREVDAACVHVNASTRFSDGFEYGLGAEIGISTDKLHARGPMGLEELTTYKYVVEGAGQIRN